jgi:hypothetical protein
MTIQKCVDSASVIESAKYIKASIDETSEVISSLFLDKH